MKRSIILFLVLFSLNAYSQDTLSVEPLIGFTYLFENSELFILNEDHKTYYYIGKIDSSGRFNISMDNGMTHNPTFLFAIWEDLWEDEPSELKIWVNYDIRGHLNETGIGTNEYIFTHLN